MCGSASTPSTASSSRALMPKAARSAGYVSGWPGSKGYLRDCGTRSPESVPLDETLLFPASVR